MEIKTGAYELLKIPSPVGILSLIANQTHLCSLAFTEETRCSDETTENPILRKTVDQLNEYFLKKRTTFDIPLLPKGTPFQLNVWERLRKIPYGKTISYQELAEGVGSAKAFRAAGSANGKNPLTIIIPCHRVINKSGDIGGFGGGLWRKRKLLELEGCTNFIVSRETI